MNEFEQSLYTRGLEKLYGNILLNEPQALEQIERLVRLTRILGQQTTASCLLREELQCIQDFAEACWQEPFLTAEVMPENAQVRLPDRRLAKTVCLRLLELEKQMLLPDLLRVSVDTEQVLYQLFRGEHLLWQGVEPYA